jgi:hypothetical protein
MANKQVSYKCPFCNFSRDKDFTVCPACGTNEKGERVWEPLWAKEGYKEPTDDGGKKKCQQ